MCVVCWWAGVADLRQEVMAQTLPAVINFANQSHDPEVQGSTVCTLINILEDGTWGILRFCLTEQEGWCRERAHCNWSVVLRDVFVRVYVGVDA